LLKVDKYKSISLSLQYNEQVKNLKLNSTVLLIYTGTNVTRSDATEFCFS